MLRKLKSYFGIVSPLDYRFHLYIQDGVVIKHELMSNNLDLLYEETFNCYPCELKDDKLDIYIEDVDNDHKIYIKKVYPSLKPNWLK